MSNSSHSHILQILNRDNQSDLSEFNVTFYENEYGSLQTPQFAPRHTLTRINSHNDDVNDVSVRIWKRQGSFQCLRWKVSHRLLDALRKFVWIYPNVQKEKWQSYWPHEPRGPTWAHVFFGSRTWTDLHRGHKDFKPVPDYALKIEIKS